jgi:hypothetical protein
MSKRKAAASKQAHSKVAAKAQRASQTVVRSPNPPHLRSVAPTSAKSSPVLPTSSEAAVFEKPATATSVPEKPTRASQNDSQRMMRDNDLTRPFDLFSAAANFKAYQRRLPEVVQAYMQFPFEFAQRLAQVKSPFEIPSVFADLATKQFTLLQNLVIPNQSSR